MTEEQREDRNERVWTIIIYVLMVAALILVVFVRDIGAFFGG